MPRPSDRQARVGSHLGISQGDLGLQFLHLLLQLLLLLIHAFTVTPFSLEILFKDLYLEETGKGGVW